LGLLRIVSPKSSGNKFNSPPKLWNGLIRLRVGDEAREVAGEKTPTPDSFSLENNESSNPESSANPLLSSSVTPLESGGVTLLASEGVSKKPVDDDEVSSMRMEGMASLDMCGLSVVEALATSTTPSVRAMT
jgi:hypothetical protein